MRTCPNDLLWFQWHCVWPLESSDTTNKYQDTSASSPLSFLLVSESKQEHEKHCLTRATRSVMRCIYCQQHNTCLLSSWSRWEAPWDHHGPCVGACHPSCEGAWSRGGLHVGACWAGGRHGLQAASSAGRVHPHHARVPAVQHHQGQACHGQRACQCRGRGRHRWGWRGVPPVGCKAVIYNSHFCIPHWFILSNTSCPSQPWMS